MLALFLETPKEDVMLAGVIKRLRDDGYQVTFEAVGPVVYVVTSEAKIEFVRCGDVVHDKMWLLWNGPTGAAMIAEALNNAFSSLPPEAMEELAIFLAGMDAGTKLKPEHNRIREALAQMAAARKT